jgi:hypothetical protein
MKKIIPEKSLSPDNKLFIIMTKKKVNKFSTWKKKKPLERRVADDLVKKSELNDKLRDKKIDTSFLDLF